MIYLCLITALLTFVVVVASLSVITWFWSILTTIFRYLNKPEP